MPKMQSLLAFRCDFDSLDHVIPLKHWFKAGIEPHENGLAILYLLHLNSMIRRLIVTIGQSQ